MKILVLSDSHSSLSFMRYCIDRVQPEHVVHLGDHFDDGVAMAQENPHIRFHKVPGNCDRYRMENWEPEILCYAIGGVKLFMTHGHKHGVKTQLYRLILEGRKSGAQAILFGHTHQAYCVQEEDGIWVLNPGSCGSWGGSAGIIEIQNGKISACYLVKQADLEKM